MCVTLLFVFVCLSSCFIFGLLFVLDLYLVFLGEFFCLLVGFWGGFIFVLGFFC